MSKMVVNSYDNLVYNLLPVNEVKKMISSLTYDKLFEAAWKGYVPYKQDGIALFRLTDGKLLSLSRERKSLSSIRNENGLSTILLVIDRDTPFIDFLKSKGVLNSDYTLKNRLINYDETLFEELKDYYRKTYYNEEKGLYDFWLNETLEKYYYMSNFIKVIK